jgi:hypothetical protein
MRDDAVRSLLARLESERPPLTIEVDRILRRGQRIRRRRRRWGTAAGTLGAVAAIMLLAVWLWQRPVAAPEVRVPRPAGPVPSVSSTSQPPRCVLTEPNGPAAECPGTDR